MPLRILYIGGYTFYTTSAVRVTDMDQFLPAGIARTLELLLPLAVITFQDDGTLVVLSETVSPLFKLGQASSEWQIYNAATVTWAGKLYSTDCKSIQETDLHCSTCLSVI